MKKIYVDAAFNDEHGVGAYCMVIVDEEAGTKDWEIYRFDGGRSAMDAERAGIQASLAKMATIRPDTRERARIYCDSVGAIKQCVPEAAALNIRLKWIKAHRMHKEDETVTEDRKRQHWADIHANQYLKNVVDLISTSVNNARHGQTAGMETTK